MTGKVVHEKAVALLARIDEWGRSPMIGASESDPAVMQAQAIAFLAEAVALLATQYATRDT